ncbi:hypothetical protein [Chloroflexus sp.]|uniref:hypothetical protein n=1 Tax=Chloroflexus sp. TaxID=1904827 RepID=UPI002ACD5515|nr:hypothetical protein [Chloroflexus sp.]
MAKIILQIGTSRIVLMDSISYVDESDRGAFVVSGSHGGTSSARYALAVPLAGVVFNDAGIGKDNAGIAGIAMLDAQRIPAMAIAHTSARIGDAADTWEHGIISACNVSAAALGVRVGMKVREAAEWMLREGGFFTAEGAEAAEGKGARP